MTNVIEQRPPKINSVTIRRAIREIERMRAEEEARRWRMWHLYGIEVRNWQRPIINVTA